MKRLVFLTLLCLGLLSPVFAQAGAPLRTVGERRFALELDGKIIAWPKTAEGGMALGEVAVSKLGSDSQLKKQIASIKFEPITLELPLDFSPALIDWVNSKGSARSRSGALITTDNNFQVISRLEFRNASLTEFTLPSLDSNSKEIGSFRLSFAPESTRLIESKDAKLTPPPAGKQTRWQAENFRLSIAGLDCSRVSKIAPLSLQISQSPDQVGARNTPTAHPATISVSDLVVQIADARAASFTAWYQDFLLNGNHLEANEKEGKLELLAPNLKDVLFTVNLHHIGIYKYHPLSDGGDGIAKTQVTFYLEGMDFIAAPT